LALLFCSAIFIPLVIGITEPDKATSSVEKRNLATLPKLPHSVAEIRQYPPLFDKYYSDHFGFRDLLTTYYKRLKYALGDSPSHDVTIGKDGWLFLGSIKKGYSAYDDPIGDYRNVNLYSEDELEKLTEHMIALKSWLHQRGIEYLLVIAPNKHSIYGEYLPDYISRVGPRSATDQLVAYLESHSSIDVVDLRLALMAAKNDRQLYFKRDTHWNSYGANIAQFQILAEVSRRFPNQITASLVENFAQETLSGGDLANFIGLLNATDKNPRPIFDDSCQPSTHPQGATGTDIHTLICPNNKLDALIYRDSFFSELEPYIARKFRHSTYIWEKLGQDSLIAQIDQHQPDIVIEEWVERSLPYVPRNNAVFQDAYLKTLFASGKPPVFRNEWEKLSFSPGLKATNGKDDPLKLQSTEKDPIITFAPLAINSTKTYIIRLQLTSSKASTLQLFYSEANRSGYPFAANRMKSAMISKGRNEIYLRFGNNNLGNLLRVDPLVGTGSVVLEQVEIREIQQGIDPA
jgi:hypothetical protein